MAEDADKSARNGDALLAAALGGGNPRVDQLLARQVVIADLQIEEMKREDQLRHWSLVVRHISDVLKLSFELALALIFTAIVFVIAAAIRSAATDSGVVIEAFSVPPDLAARGLTGDVIATKVLDRLSAMQAQTASRRAASSYANDWGKNIKVQIPDTGVSIGELNNFLHDWLGHQTHIGGEIYRAANGIAVTARAGDDASPTFTGADADLDKLIQQAAEAVYRSTQPYRYGIWLQRIGRGAGLGLYRARQSVAEHRRLRRRRGDDAPGHRHQARPAAGL